MVQYSPPPENLDELNPIQRYLQKGKLDWQDYLRLIALVIAYFMLRPYIEKLAKWWFGGSQLAAGEKAQNDYAKQRAKAKIGANAIRGLEKEDSAEVQLPEKESTQASGSQPVSQSRAISRKTKQTPDPKSQVDQLMDWDDEPARQPAEGDGGDVLKWLDKWDR